MVDIHKAIPALYSNIASIEQYSDGTLIVKNKEGNTVDVDMSLVNAWVDPEQYKIDRAFAYPSIKEQLDMQYWDRVNGTTTWADAIAKVKADFPKG
jgi:hypothetical protein